jgi:sugar phosphate isomerase/epimerase
MELNLSIRAHDFNQVSDANKLAKNINSYGIESIQFAPPISFPHIPSEGYNINPGMGNYYRKIFGKYNINITILSCYINMIHPVETERKKVLNKFHSYLNTAKSFGADVVATETGCVDEEIHYTEENFTDSAFESVVESVEKLINHAEKIGMLVAIEGGKNHPIHTPQKMKKLLDRIDSPNLQVILDVTNYLMPHTYTNQRTIIDQSLELFGDRLVAVHLKDFIVENNEIKPVTIGEGEMDFPYLLTKINENKPYLNLVMEETKEDNLDKAIKYLTDISNKM